MQQKPLELQKTFYFKIITKSLKKNIISLNNLLLYTRIRWISINGFFPYFSDKNCRIV